MSESVERVKALYWQLDWLMMYKSCLASGCVLNIPVNDHKASYEMGINLHDIGAVPEYDCIRLGIDDIKELAEWWESKKETT